MSLELVSEPVCYVHCNLCNTILAVSVPSSSLFNIVTVRCGHCGNLLSVNMGASLQTLPLQDPQSQKLLLINSEDLNKNFGSSSKCNKVTASESTEHEPPRMPAIRPPEKRQRVPSAYNRFIKEEIQRIKASNPDISHREAFSTAAKNLKSIEPGHGVGVYYEGTDAMMPREKNRKGTRAIAMCIVTGATRFVCWDGAKSTESDMSNHAVCLLDLCGDKQLKRAERDKEGQPGSSDTAFSRFQHQCRRYF
ncbi:hypothetical protein D5086_001937 [Populus alba]|uniref:Uncharacterized protein n=1 Tax=Populus alba TaxID=43335 RepID=A0ACC4D1B2_POPAL